MKKRTKSKEIVRKPKNNLNNTKSQKIWLRTWKSDDFRTKFDFHRLDKLKKDADRRMRHTEKMYEREKLRLDEKLEIADKLLLLTERFNKRVNRENSIKARHKASHFQ